MQTLFKIILIGAVWAVGFFVFAMLSMASGWDTHVASSPPGTLAFFMICGAATLVIWRYSPNDGNPKSDKPEKEGISIETGDEQPNPPVLPPIEDPKYEIIEIAEASNIPNKENKYEVVFKRHNNTFSRLVSTVIRVKGTKEKWLIEKLNTFTWISETEYIEDTKYEIIEIAEASNIPNKEKKYAVVFKRQNNTYTYLVRTKIHIKGNKVKCLIETLNTFTWISETEHNNRQKAIAEAVENQKIEQAIIDKQRAEAAEKAQQERIANIIPINPKIEVVKPEVEEQNKIKFIGYEPSMQFAQQEPLTYPMVFMPKPKSVIKFPRKGKQGFKGVTEDRFKQNIIEHFKNIFQIYDDRFVLYKSNQNPYEPDFTLIDEKNELNLFIDIEIDEPYDGVSRQPIHYTGVDKQRNEFFRNRGWIVIRFAEYQIFTETLSCCKFIAEVVKSINPDFVISNRLSKANDITPISQWTKEQAIKWANQKYREQYLGIDKFTKQEHQIILGNLDETEIGENTELLVIEEQVNSISYKKSLILQAIKDNNFISCRLYSSYTVIKPIEIQNESLTCFCYLKNLEIQYNMNEINDIILREKPFVFRINGAVGVEEIKSFIMKYIGSENPIRIKYTKSTFGLWDVDEETDQIICDDEDIESLRTVTDFDIVSEVYTSSDIRKYKLNDTDYIAGFCNKRDDLRTFKFNRINELEILNI